jgi:hypothetical protein
MHNGTRRCSGFGFGFGCSGSTQTQPLSARALTDQHHAMRHACHANSQQSAASSKQQPPSPGASSAHWRQLPRAKYASMQADKTSAKTGGAVEISGLFGAAHTWAHRQPILSTPPSPTQPTPHPPQRPTTTVLARYLLTNACVSGRDISSSPAVFVKPRLLLLVHAETRRALRGRQTHAR